MRRYGLILVALAVLVAGVVVLSFFRSPTLGLDLQGGLEVVLEAQPLPGEEVSAEDLDRSVEIIRNRIDKLGVAEPEIRKQGADQIAIELAGVTDQERATAVIGKTAQLEFYDLEGDLLRPSIDTAGFPIPSRTLYPLLKQLEPQAAEGTPSAWYLYSDTVARLGGPEPTQAAVLEALELDEAPEGSEFLAVPEGMIILTCGAAAGVCPGVNGLATTDFYYVFRHQPTDAEDPVPEMTGDDLELRGTRQDFDPTSGQAVVLMQFTDVGADKFQEITRELAARGRLRTGQLGAETPLLQHFAIVLDGEIRSWPSIDFQQYPSGISGRNGAQITGLDSVQEAQDLALVLQTGALPLRFDVLERTAISATLGEDSLREALIAAVGGLAAVALFLLLVYRFLGMVAIAGLAIYGALLYGAILLFGVTLTLPGFAGLILTIGIAADANIVIFERIKEEYRARGSVRSAIATGYKRGFSTIVDANVVTMITAFVIFIVATAGVRGFALMLLIGTAISMLTAVVATRALLGILSRFRWFDNPAFMGATGKKIPRWQRIDFMGRRRLWAAVSITVLAVGIGSLAAQGLNLGIDFRGGSQVSFTTPEPVPVEDVRGVAAEVVPASAVVQGRGEEQAGGFTSFQIKTETLTPEETSALGAVLEDELAAESFGARSVSGSFSSQILRGAVLAVVVSLALIALYVAIRFQWKFAIPVLIALAHDIAITFGVYSLTQREVTTATVAAILTILGYSIYDTIIIFDRIRENVPIMRRSSFAAIANQSIWETLRRSVATTFITLLPVASLLVFGGDTLKDFAFALLVGIFSGAYSTIFVAIPILTWIKEREPDYAERKGQDQPVEKLEVLEVEPEPEAVEPEEEEAEEDEELVPVVAERTLEARDEDVAAQPERVAAGEGKPAPRADATERREQRRKRRRAKRHGRPR